MFHLKLRAKARKSAFMVVTDGRVIAGAVAAWIVLNEW